ncbi:MFS transporter (thymic stromal cotransporter) [Sarotherodon galilaeus]
MDELTSLTWSQREYRQCSIMMLTESWLTSLTPDTSVTLPGFQLLRADRTRDSGDFNHASLDSTLPTFTQYVTCPTRDNKTLDLLYANAEEAYSSSPLPALGRSDHNLVHLVPVYEPLVRREPPATRTVQRWSEESEEALKDCFESTVWEVICDDHGEDIDSLTTCITDYINFCVDNTVPTRTVRCFSNNKPWITPEIKAVLKQKRRAFKSKDKEELKRVQRELRGLIRNGKDSYRQKMENQLQQNNVGEVWRGLRTISGHKHQNSLPGRDVSLTASEHYSTGLTTAACGCTLAHLQSQWHNGWLFVLLNLSAPKEQ